MKKVMKLACSAVLMMAASAASAVELGVVQLSKVMQTSKAGQELATVLRSKDQEAQQALQKIQQEIQGAFRSRAEKAQKDFELQKDLLSPDQLKAEQQKLGAALQSMQAAAAQEFEGRRRQIISQSNKAKRQEENKVLSQVNQIVETIAKERKFDLILTEAGVALVPNKSLDITDQVIERMDQKKAGK